MANSRAANQGSISKNKRLRDISSGRRHRPWHIPFLHSVDPSSILQPVCRAGVYFPLSVNLFVRRNGSRLQHSTVDWIRGPSRIRRGHELAFGDHISTICPEQARASHVARLHQDATAGRRVSTIYHCSSFSNQSQLTFVSQGHCSTNSYDNFHQSPGAGAAGIGAVAGRSLSLVRRRHERNHIPSGRRCRGSGAGIREIDSFCINSRQCLGCHGVLICTGSALATAERWYHRPAGGARLCGLANDKSWF